MEQNPNTVGSYNHSHNYHHNSKNGPHIANSSLTPPTPLFERLVTEEVQELKSCLRMIDNQQRRIDELEKVHGDLENRLELESRGRSQLEITLEQREREWASKFQQLQAERDEWQQIVQQEKSKNNKLVQQINRKDKDIHRMLQRKYDKREDSPNLNHSIRNLRHLTTPQPTATHERAMSTSSLQRSSNAERNSANNLRTGEPQQYYQSPHEILAASGSMEAVRIRNVQNLLADFFGF